VALNAPLPGGSSDEAMDMAPPLRVWWAVAMATALLAALPWCAYRRFGLDEDASFMAITRARLEQFAQEPGRGPRIVAVGTSLLYRATWQDHAMAAAAATHGASNWRFLRIARGAGGWRDLQLLTGPILETRPDLLIVQYSMLFERPARMGYPEFASHRWRSWLLRLAGRPSLQLRTNLIRDDERGAGWTRHSAAAQARYLERLRRRLDLRPPPPTHEIRAWLDRVTAAGTRVMILDLPRPPEVRAAGESALAALGGNELRQWLARDGRAGWRACPEEFPLEMFRDYSHLNPAGRERFLPWLVAVVEEELARAGEGRRR